MNDKLEVQEGIQQQSADEILVYSITTTNFASNPTSPTIKVFDTNDGSDVTTTVMPTGSASASGDVIALPALKALIAGHEYRVEVKFVSGVNTWECYFKVRCIF